MLVSGLVKSSLVDYPEKIAAVIFTPGCNFDCFYCHNRHLIKNSKGSITEEEVIEFLEKRKGLLDAAVISGGEPTLQKDLITFIKKIKKLGYLIKLDSNGFKPDVIREVLDLVDYFAIDYKAPQSKYQDITGKDGSNVLTTINMLHENHKVYEVRTTLAPTLTIKDFETMKSELPKVPLWRINEYRMPETYKEEDKKRLKKKPLDIVLVKEIIKEYQTV